jgi:hypothetical protein
MQIAPQNKEYFSTWLAGSLRGFPKDLQRRNNQ